MHQEGIWPAYEIFYIESMLFNTEHALNSIQYVSESIQRLDASHDPKQFQKIDEESFLNHVQNIVLQGAALSRYFWPARDAHNSRGSALRRAFEVSDESPLKNRDLRNAVEHFDERIDRYLAKGIVGYVFPRFVGTTPRSDGGVPSHIFRAYYLDTGRFQILSESFEIKVLAQEILRIHDLLTTFNQNGGRLRGSST